MQLSRSTGAGRAWTARPSRPKRAACHRPEPDGSGQAGHQAPPRHRRARHAARLLPERGQPARRRDDGPDPRGHPAPAQRPARTPTTPTRQAARRQGLRCQSTPPGVSGARDRAAHRPQRHRVQPEARPPSLGRRSFDKLRMRAPTLGSIVSAACPSATSDAPTSTRPSPASPQASSPSTRSDGSVRRSIS